MAGPRKKTRQDSEDQKSDSSSDGESYHGQQEIQATFEGRNPEEQDFHGIKQLLKQLFLKAHIDLSQLSDLLISQNGIGSVLKQGLGDSDDEDDVDMDNDNDVFGITSIVNLSAYSENPCIQEFYSLIDEILKKHGDQQIAQQFKDVLHSGKKIGFLINERFVNIPAQISVAMLGSLKQEIERAKKKDASYNFDYYILICKTCKSKDSNEVIFSNDEEEIFAKQADLSFEFCVQNEADTGLGGRWGSEDKESIPYRRIIVFNANKFSPILNQIGEFVKS